MHMSSSSRQSLVPQAAKETGSAAAKNTAAVFTSVTSNVNEFAKKTMENENVRFLRVSRVLLPRALICTRAPPRLKWQQS